REALKATTLSDQDRDQLVQWTWHTDPTIAKAVRNWILLIFDTELTIACFGRFSDDPQLGSPFMLTYNSAEKEFHVDLDGIPGFVVSYYGRDDQQTGRLLGALERV